MLLSRVPGLGFGQRDTATPQARTGLGPPLYPLSQS